MLDYSREFIVLAASLNYTKAAAKLNMSQSSLSRHIADLERELGFSLFDRNPLALTAAGRHYMEAISALIERLDEAVDEGRSIANRDGGEFSVYMLPTDSLYASVVYESVARIRKHAPSFSPRFRYTDRDSSVFDAVLSGKAEMGILLGKPAEVPEGYACEWLVDSPVVAWLHEDSPVLQRGIIRFEDLADCYLVRSTTQSSHTWSDGMASIYSDHGVEPKFHLRDLENKESFYLTLRPDEVLLASDEGSALCKYNPSLVKVEFADPPLFFSTHMLYGVPSAPLVRKLVEMCHRVVEECGSRFESR